MKERYFPCSIDQAPDEGQQEFGLNRCMQTKPGPDVQVAIIGDSHGEHLFVGLAEVAPETNVMYVFLYNWPTRVTQNANLTLNEVAHRSSIRTVLLSSHWNGQIPDAPLSESIRLLTDAGKKIFVADDVPDFAFEASACIRQVPNILAQRCTESASEYQLRYRDHIKLVEGALRDNPAATLLRTTRYFCDSSVCNMRQSGQLMYEDGHHLNMIGSKFVAQRLIRDYPAFGMAIGVGP
jgi:hypothetical protein